MSQPSDPVSNYQGPSSHWQPPPKRGLVGSISRFLVLIILATMLVLPFTPFAAKIKNGLKELVIAIRGGERTRVITKEVPVEVPREVIKEVIKEVQVPAPLPPLPSNYVPRKDVDVATFFNGITIKSKLVTEQGNYASFDRQDPDAYRAEFQLTVRVPKANQSLDELKRLNSELPRLLPGLDAMLPGSKVSGFYHKLYENKTNGIQRDITRLNRILDRHNFFDCETILELTHPETKRRALLIQSEMDVVADGSDGDRQPSLDEYIYMSDYYQPFTSYAWSKRSKTPNPLLARWEERLKKANEAASAKGISADRKREAKELAKQLQIEIAEMKSRSSLIAEKDPFIVISLLFRPFADQNKHTPKIGDYAVVIHEGKMYPAICGDYGPTMKMGEASLFICKAINDKATPYRRPESDLKVTYLIFPGTAEKPNQPPNLDHWHEQCAKYLTEIGTQDAAQLLHRWEDPFKKPEPPPTPDTTTTVGGLTTPATPNGTAAAAGPAPAAGTPVSAPPAPSGTAPSNHQPQATPADPNPASSAPTTPPVPNSTNPGSTGPAASPSSGPQSTSDTNSTPATTTPSGASTPAQAAPNPSTSSSAPPKPPRTQPN